MGGRLIVYSGWENAAAFLWMAYDPMRMLRLVFANGETAPSIARPDTVARAAAAKRPNGETRDFFNFTVHEQAEC